ncbi:MAG: hypothetical protein ACHQ51_02335 [Elusimicrobiota bacterium]
MKNEVAAMGGQVNGLSQKVARLDERVTHLDEKVTHLDEKVTHLDEKVTHLDEKVTHLDEKLTRVAVTVARIEGDMFEVRQGVSELKGLRLDFMRFQSFLDASARNMETFERWCRSQGSMLMEHEGRITKLESRPQ